MKLEEVSAIYLEVEIEFIKWSKPKNMHTSMSDSTL